MRNLSQGGIPTPLCCVTSLHKASPYTFIAYTPDFKFCTILHALGRDFHAPQLHSGLYSRACLFTQDDHSTTKFPVHQIKSGETHCFDSPLKSILINYSVLKYCSGLINLIKS